MTSRTNIFTPPHLSLSMPPPSDGGGFYVSKKVVRVVIHFS